MATQRVLGLGGIFFKSKDPAALSAWYAKHLGFDVQPWGGACFPAADQASSSVWSPFPSDTRYFAPSDKPFMINLRVRCLKSLLPVLRSEGVQVLDRFEDCDQGLFGYVLDPDGNLIELWEPAADPAT